MTKIDFSIGKVVKMTKIWGSGHGFERLWAGPPAQRQLVRGLAADLLQDPQKGPKWSKLGSNWGPVRSLQGPSRAVGQNRHILAGGQRFGLRRAQNGVKIGSKWHFHWPLIGKMTKLTFSIGKVVKMTKIGGPGHGFVRALSRSSSQKAARAMGPSQPPPGPSKGVQNGQN